jgi:hypothetical protein
VAMGQLDVELLADVIVCLHLFFFFIVFIRIFECKSHLSKLSEPC